MTGTLLDDLRVTIAQDGPLGVDRFMALALGHPRFGYYMTRDPFGALGDFTTAPEVSQMFGELVGLWAAEVWHGMGRPDPVRLVELGPGRGTLMADALRAARALPFFHAAIDLHLVETSRVLRDSQKRALAQQSAMPTWHESVETLPHGPAVIVANEFFDALPIRQYVHTARGWCERLIGVDEAGALAWGLAAEPESRLSVPAVDGAILEINPAGQRVMRVLAERIAGQGGAALVIDYGHAVSGFADTLQAMHRHEFVDPLASPGEADLTAHVDFAALSRTAVAAGASVHGPVLQGDFLASLGLVQRAASLTRTATAEQARAIESAVARLAGPAPGMGALFKVLAVTHPDLAVPPAFEGDVSP